jgi:hypothetical protein
MYLSEIGRVKQCGRGVEGVISNLTVFVNIVNPHTRPTRGRGREVFSRVGTANSAAITTDSLDTSGGLAFVERACTV